MNTRCALATAMVVLCAVGAGAVERVSVAMQDLLGGKRFKPIATVAALPEAARGALARQFGQQTLEMADPGEPFQVTDVVADRSLPGRRLIFAGQDGDLVVVHYEIGGYAHNYNLVVLRTTGGATRIERAAMTKGALAGLSTLREVGSRVVDTVFDPFPY